MKLYISEPEQRESGPILIYDDAHNDIAEFFHNEHATVGQSYETALALAQKLVTCGVAQPTPEAVAWRVKNDHGHWYVTQHKDLADTWRDFEGYEVQDLYVAQPPAAPVTDTASRIDRDYTHSRLSAGTECDFERDGIARCLFNKAMSGHAQWDEMTEPNKEDWRVRADAWILDVTSLIEMSRSLRCLKR